MHFKRVITNYHSGIDNNGGAVVAVAASLLSFSRFYFVFTLHKSGDRFMILWSIFIPNTLLFFWGSKSFKAADIFNPDWKRAELHW